MDSFKLADFFFERVQETIALSRYIREVSISYYLDGNFGNEYINVTYRVSVNDEFGALPENVQQTMFNRKPNHTFSLSTYAEIGKSSEKRKLFRITEFKHIYESLTAYIVMQFENTLGLETSIKIKGIDLWPEANYAEKYLDDALYVKERNRFGSPFEADVAQWDDLHKLAIESKKIYVQQNTYFKITDLEINDLFNLEPDDVRYLVLRHRIPVKIKGIKTIGKIYIHTLRLVEALKREINKEYRDNQRDYLYKRLIVYLYDHYLTTEKAKIIAAQQSAYLANFLIRKGDILQLKDGRIVLASSIEIDSQNLVIIEYTVLKVNLQPGSRKRKVPFNCIGYVLKETDFKEYKDYTPSKRRTLLNKWMLRKRKKIDLITAFKPDLMAGSEMN